MCDCPACYERKKRPAPYCQRCGDSMPADTPATMNGEWAVDLCAPCDEMLRDELHAEVATPRKDES